MQHAELKDLLDLNDDKGLTEDSCQENRTVCNQIIM